jgi:hypothetical protein
MYRARLKSLLVATLWAPISNQLQLELLLLLPLPLPLLMPRKVDRKDIHSQPLPLLPTITKPKLSLLHMTFAHTCFN